MEDIHSENYVKSLFEEMSKTYGIVNILSSLGLAYLWRKYAVSVVPPHGGMICDIMAGGAECLSHIKQRFGGNSQVHLVDWCEKMCDRARRSVDRRRYKNCTVINASALEIPVPDATYDAVISTFGLKTLTLPEIDRLAEEIGRVLKPGGSVSILEFSVPPNSFIQIFFRMYVKYYVPFIGWMFLGSPDNYRMLWRYTKEFRNCQDALRIFREKGFDIRFDSYLFGSATHISGRSQQALRVNFATSWLRDSS